MTTQEFKIELRKLNLQVNDQIILKWKGINIKKSNHVVTRDLIAWINVDSNNKSSGLISNPLEDDINFSEFNMKQVDLNGISFSIAEGYMPVKTIPLKIKFSREAEATYIEEAALGHLEAIALK